ncbi:hypothetical protein KIW84_074051 [Lathyrus oleraceus]|uniref:Uncharacterized protein n=1 Tax=Pisum sativum TaxID=3888 RepID=A0A9D4ZZF5_PEA|nr:hypothetical protein KIW84_074051 [Pisum sativum]
MLLRSGKIAINDERRTGRESQTRMANMNPPETQNSQNSSTNNIVPSSSSIGASTGTKHVSEVVQSMVSSMPTHSISHSESILTYIRPRGPPHTPSPIRDIPNRSLVPPGFSIPFGGREQPYGMLTSMMANLQNNTTQSNQQMTTQVARMSEFLGIPQHQHPLPRDWVRENQEPTFEEDLTINQIPQNQGGIVVPPRIEPHVPREPRVLMVNRNQNDDDVIRQVRHDDVAANNNLTNIVERIMV